MLFTFVLVVLNFIKLNEGGTICKVPNGDAGTCIDIQKCKPLSDIYNKRHKTEAEHTFFQQAYCGNPTSNKFKICCPEVSLWETFVINPVKYTQDLFGDIDVEDKITPPKTQPPLKRKPPQPISPLNGIGPLPLDRNDIIEKINTPQKQDISAACGTDVSSANKITGGEPTAIDQYPWLVLLEYASGAFGCGGSLITAEYVLTAAHCIESINGPPVIARLSEYNTTSYPVDEVEADGGGIETITVTLVAVKDTIAHPNFTRAVLLHDIGLVRLMEKAVFSDFIKIICLPTKDYTPGFTTSVNFTVAGWGDDTRSLENFDVKKHVIIPYVPITECMSRYSSIDAGSHICAGGEDGKDTCKGDSGGPLMYNNDNVFILLGVVSRGPRKCGTKGMPAVYTNVYKYLDWINSIIGRT